MAPSDGVTTPTAFTRFEYSPKLKKTAIATADAIEHIDNTVSVTGILTKILPKNSGRLESSDSGRKSGTDIMSRLAFADSRDWGSLYLESKMAECRSADLPDGAR
jgi:hypothetical protein